ncbi:MAG TPA: flagellar hook-basal body complex protein FliE [Bryobacteraceae bacterium]|jgi:flagellar hook-basal body complex protein FliE|nr:flagellar hook-basal body complex protein FliE [Bryobacteraceae bacterium]
MNILSTVSTAIQPVTLPGLSGSGAAGGGSGGFADAFASAIQQVESDQQTAKAAATDLLAGGKGDIHNVALATQRAELSMELFQQVRNKFVQAYQEVMKMPM